MIRIPCPFCGTRDHAEFEYAGDASVAYPPLDGATEAWFAAVFLRDDPKGRHAELWRHARGCKSWLVVERDTRTHEIFSSRMAHPAKQAACAPETTR